MQISLQSTYSVNLTRKNFAGIGTDGASVMTGRRNGVVKQLQDKCPSLVGVHYAAHRCALAASQAAQKIPEMEKLCLTFFAFLAIQPSEKNKLKRSKGAFTSAPTEECRHPFCTQLYKEFP